MADTDGTTKKQNEQTAVLAGASAGMVPEQSNPG